MHDFRGLYEKAREAGLAAGEAAKPRPMIVGTPTTPFGNEIDYTKRTYFEPEGVCGFAWVVIKGNTAFGRWAKKAGLASKNYPKGLMFWVRDFNQSMARKEAYARAFAKVLNDGGVNAYANSRLD